MKAIFVLTLLATTLLAQELESSTTINDSVSWVKCINDYSSKVWLQLTVKVLNLLVHLLLLSWYKSKLMFKEIINYWKNNHKSKEELRSLSKFKMLDFSLS